MEQPTIRQQRAPEILTGLFSNVCCLIVLVSPCSHKSFIRHPWVSFGEEELGYLYLTFNMEGEGGGRPYPFGTERSGPGTFSIGTEQPVTKETE